MKKLILTVLPMALAATFGVVAAFATGGADEPSDGVSDNVFLGEQDLAERMEIWRNQFHRMTPGDAPLVQNVGTWPAAWEEFSHAWAVAPAERDLATWLVPVTAERSGALTVLRDANGAVLWSGTTDFAKDESASVTLTGALVSEDDWALWEAARQEIARRLQESGTPRLRDGEGGGGSELTALRFVSAEADFTNTPPEFRVGLAWTNSGTLDVFAYGPLHVAETNEVTYTNDENVVVNTNVVTWHSVELSLSGFDNDWTWVGTLVVTNSETNVFVDTSFTEDRAKVRFYAAAQVVDSDGDGLNDGFEVFVSHSDPESEDGDHDGIGDAQEFAAGSKPSVSNVWWITTTTNEVSYWEYVGNQQSWPGPPVQKFETNIVGNAPALLRVVKDVRIDGEVDDVIKVGTYDVNTNRGPKTFVNLSITNINPNLQSGEFTLRLFDYPAQGHSGHNEVRLGTTNGVPFRVFWEWWTPFDVRLEPIWTSSDWPLDNPSGIVLGSNAWFNVDPTPYGLVPETNVVWTSSNSNLTFVTTNRGTRVQVHGNVLGNDELCVRIDGTQGELELPPFHVKVVPLTLVTAKVGIVVSTNQVPAREENAVRNIFQTANNLLIQLGLQIVPMEPFVYIPDEGGFFDVIETTPEEQTLKTRLSQPGGMEVYFVASINSPNGNPIIGNNSPTGLLVGGLGDGRAMAHETGHACGLRDIYMSHEGTSMTVDWEPSPSVMPDDWGHYVTDYGDTYVTRAVLERLLMYGVDSGYNADIPSGFVKGLAYVLLNGEKDWELEEVYVGQTGVTQWPNHQ